MTLRTIIGLPVVICLAVAAATQSVTPPVLTFVVDGARNIRPLLGIPGSASIGAPLNVGFEIVSAEIPSGNDYILAISREHDWPFIVRARGNDVSVRSTEPQSSVARRARSRRSGQSLDRQAEATTKIDRIALSPTGSAAAFLSESQGRVYVFTNLSQSPALTGEFEVGQLGPLTAFGISDDARTVVIGVSDGSTGSLFLVNVNRTGTSRLVASMQRPSAIRFLRGSSNSVVADDAENKVYALFEGQLFPIAAAEHGISGPIGLAISRDNQKVFVGNAASGSVTTVVLNGGVAETRSCDCTLTGLHETNAESVFRLTDPTNGPVLLFDASTATPRMAFVPLDSR